MTRNSSSAKACRKFCARLSRRNSFRFSNGLRFCNLPRPKFQIGQYISWGYWCNDDRDKERFGKFIKYHGFITGMTYDNPEFNKPCWSYQIHWTLFEGVPASEFTWDSTEFVAEDELKRAA